MYYIPYITWHYLLFLQVKAIHTSQLSIKISISSCVQILFFTTINNFLQSQLNSEQYNSNNQQFEMAPVLAAAPRLLTAAIAAVAWSSNRLDVFKLGPSTDLQHLWWGGMSPSSCSSFHPLHKLTTSLLTNFLSFLSSLHQPTIHSSPTSNPSHHLTT